MSSPAPKIFPVILSGGAGTRLWPLSRKAFPKQLLALGGGPDGGADSLLQQTARRVGDPTRFHPPIVIANDLHRFIVRDQLDALDVSPSALLLEPMGRNTAPAVALAALTAAQSDPAAIVAILPSDHRIGDDAAFQSAMDRAASAAAEGYLVTFGITPSRPETGYGYIKAGAALDGLEGAHAVARFVEKPDEATAAGFLAEGGYSWNSGMFVFQASRMLEEMDAHMPETLKCCRAALDAAEADFGFSRLPEDLFAAIPASAIDTAVMERTTRAAVVPVDMGWSDLGAFASLRETGAQDPSGNVTQGDVMLSDCRDSFLASDGGGLVTGIGLDAMVVVATKDAVLVAPAARADEVKAMVATLESQGRTEPIHHARVHRPWGTYQDIDQEPDFRVKRIVVKPGGRLSLQRHGKRSEHWIVVQGTAHVTVGAREEILHRNQSTYVPVGETHRLENRSAEALHLIEVQVGDYVGEDDIERLEDVYGRKRD